MSKVSFKFQLLACTSCVISTRVGYPSYENAFERSHPNAFDKTSNPDNAIRCPSRYAFQAPLPVLCLQ